MSGIKLSKKHGVNPSMDICMFCGEAKGIVLMGKLPNDVEAPRGIITNYEPCNVCKEKFKNDIIVIEVSSKPLSKNQPPIQAGAYPTGRWVGVPKQNVTDPDRFEKDTGLMWIDEFQELFGGSFNE